MFRNVGDRHKTLVREQWSRDW